jgi:hypothetical protein
MTLPAWKPCLPAQLPVAQPAPQDPTSACKVQMHLSTFVSGQELARTLCGPMRNDQALNVSPWITSDMRGHSERSLAHEWQEFGRSLHFASRRRARSLSSGAMRRARQSPPHTPSLSCAPPVGRATRDLRGSPQIYSMPAGGPDGESSSEPLKNYCQHWLAQRLAA